MQSYKDVVYYDDEGKELDEPEIEAARTGKRKSYSMEDHRYGLGAAESIGRRKEQEDRIAYLTIPPAFLLLSDEEQDTVLQDTINQINAHITEEQSNAPIIQNSSLYGGSCLLTCIISPLPNQAGYRLTGINLGDSELLVAKRNDENGKLIITRLNTLHNPKPPLVNMKIGIRLAVDHALGDSYFDDAGMKHDAEIVRKKIKADKESYVFLVCDGVREQGFPAPIFDKLIKTNADNPAKLAEAIIRKAYERRSGDNLSVYCIQLGKRQHPLEVTLALSIYDGHGSDNVSEFARKHFLTLLTQNILQAFKKKALREVHGIDPAQHTLIENTISSVSDHIVKSTDADILLTLRSASDAMDALSKELAKTTITKSPGGPLFAVSAGPVGVIKHEIDVFSLYLKSVGVEYGNKPDADSLSINKKIMLEHCKQLIAMLPQQQSRGLKRTLSATL